MKKLQGGKDARTQLAGHKSGHSINQTATFIKHLLKPQVNRQHLQQI